MDQGCQHQGKGSDVIPREHMQTNSDTLTTIYLQIQTIMLLLILDSPVKSVFSADIVHPNCVS